MDEASTSPADVPYYKTLYEHAKGSGATVWLNPGTATDEAYLNVSDVVFQFESPLTSFDSYAPPPYLKHYPPSRTGMLVMEVPDAASMNATVVKASAMGAGWTIVLGTGMGWATPKVPDFWAAEVALLNHSFRPTDTPSLPAATRVAPRF